MQSLIEKRQRKVIEAKTGTGRELSKDRQVSLREKDRERMAKYNKKSYRQRHEGKTRIKIDQTHVSQHHLYLIYLHYTPFKVMAKF